jgi:hypothetical protein
MEKYIILSKEEVEKLIEMNEAFGYIDRNGYNDKYSQTRVGCQGWHNNIYEGEKFFLKKIEYKFRQKYYMELSRYNEIFGGNVIKNYIPKKMQDVYKLPKLSGSCTDTLKVIDEKIEANIKNNQINKKFKMESFIDDEILNRSLSEISNYIIKIESKYNNYKKDIEHFKNEIIEVQEILEIKHSDPEFTDHNAIMNKIDNLKKENKDKSIEIHHLKKDKEDIKNQTVELLDDKEKELERSESVVKVQLERIKKLENETEIVEVSYKDYMDFNNLYDDYKRKADKYDAMNPFSLNIDLLIKGDIESIDNGKGRELKYEPNVIKIIVDKGLEKMEQQININIDDVEAIKQDHTLKFDYDKFERLYDDNKCDFEYIEEDGTSMKLFNSDTSFIYQVSEITDYPNKGIWRIFKDDKQLNEKEIEALLVDVKVFDDCSECEIEEDVDCGSAWCKEKCSNFIKIENNQIHCKGLELEEK